MERGKVGIRMNIRRLGLARTLVSLVALASCCHVPEQARAQSGECAAGGCLSDTQYPFGTHSSTSATFVTVANDIFAGEWARYSVTSGQTYEWSLCPADGGSAAYDATLTLRTDATPGSAICFSDDHCGASPKIRWTATGTGTVRVQVNQWVSVANVCGINALATTLRWRCASCLPPPVATIFDASWTSQVNLDGDSCPRSGTLTWDPDVADCVGTLSVFEKVYFKPAASGTWTLLTTTSAYSITGCPSTDTRALAITFAGACGAIDWMIEIFRVGQATPDYTRSPANDADLNDHPEESAANDAPPNQPPTNGSPFSQLRADTNSIIPQAGSIPFGTGVYFRVTVSDPNPADTVRLEVELRQLPATFTGVANFVSPFVANGAVATTTTATGLAAGNYGWRCRVVDNIGAASTWILEANPDFTVTAPAVPDIRVQPTSVTVNCTQGRPAEESPVTWEEPDTADAAAAAPLVIVPRPGEDAARLGVVARALQSPKIAPIHREMLDRIFDIERRADAGLAVCFAPGTDDETVAAFNDAVALMNGERFNQAPRWGITASGPAGAQGDPVVLTYSFVPDGTNIPSGVGEPAAPSNLFAFLNGIYGSPANWQSLYAQFFARWSALSGITFVYQPTDDGAAFFNTPGVLGVRGDLRLAGKAIDGNFGILAYNGFPQNGDMVIDTNDTFYTDTSGNSLKLRNVLSHEHGHGMGQAHVCPITNTKLMEPTVTTVFDGPQHDDIRSAHRHYGDLVEPDNSVASATDLGPLSEGPTLVYGPTPAPAVNFGSVLSIDADGEQDFFKFTVIGPKRLTVSVSPIGLNYDDSEQACPGQSASCCSGSFTNSQNIANLALQVIASNGITVLATAQAQPVGTAETLVDIPLPAAGAYYVRVYETSSPAESQLYHLSLQILSQTASDCFTIFNDGSATLSVTSVTKPAWATLVPAPPYSITGGGSQQVCVQACSACAGSDLVGNLTINSNDPDSPSVNVSVHVDCPAIIIPPIVTDIPNSMIQAPNAYTGPTPMLTQGTQPVSWSLVANPAGMTISSSTGVVSWPTSTATGSPHTITIRATNTAGFDNESWSLTVIPPTCPGDANNDGQVTFADITSVLENWGVSYPGSTGPGDANRDGVVNFADITKVLENWATACP